MPKGQAFDIEVTKLIAGTEIKKEGETAHTSVWTPEAGKRFRLVGFTFFVDTALCLVTLEDGETAFFNVSVEKLAAGGVFNLPQGGYLSTKVANKLQIKLSSTNKVTATFYGIEDVS